MFLASPLATCVGCETSIVYMRERNLELLDLPMDYGNWLDTERGHSGGRFEYKRTALVPVFPQTIEIVKGRASKKD